jgi:hypothetical protein
LLVVVMLGVCRCFRGGCLGNVLQCSQSTHSTHVCMYSWWMWMWTNWKLSYPPLQIK